MPISPSPRPQLKQTRSSGWGWPHLVDVKEQKEKASHQAKQISAVPKRVSAAVPSSSRNRQASSDLSPLKEEQSAPTSPNHSPGSPRDSMSGHRTEASENANAVDDQPELIDIEPADVPVLRDESHGTEGQDIDLGEQGVDGNVAEGVGKDAEPPNDSLPGAFPITPAPVTSLDDRFPGLAQAGLLPTDEEPDTTSLGHQYPGLAQDGLLPAIDQSSVAREPDAEGPCDCGDSCQCVPPCQCGDPSRSAGPGDCAKSCTCLQQCHCPESEAGLEKHTAEPGRSVTLPKKDRRVSISEPNKPLPIPTITIQRPSNSDISDIDDDEFPARSSPTPRSNAVDSVRAEERRGTKSLSLSERLDEERRLTSALTQEDRERIIQDIATDVASIPHPVTETRETVIPVEVKKRMKIRRAVEILKMRATGKAVSLTEVPGLAAMPADGGLLQH